MGKISIEISEKVYKLLEKTVKESEGEFSSVEELLEFIVREALSGEEVYSSEEEEKIKKRLRSLGYL